MADLDLDKAIRLVLAMLPQDRVATRDDIRASAEPVHTMVTAQGAVVDVEELVKEVEGRVIVWQEEGATLHDIRGHEEWLGASRADIEWLFWERYRRYLEDVKLFPPAVIKRLDQVTDSVLRKLEKPARDGPWDRRGLVVGQVQSGKTANYTGLICKAADAGYKLILVLAGTQNSLRSQTQLRVDEGFLGFDTQFQRRYDEGEAGSAFGVGLLPGAPRLRSASLTTSAEAGDFNTTVARNMALPIGDYPVVLVVKKHGGILRNIQRWMTAVHGVQNPDTEKVSIPDVPLLMIDDEADNASIDTKSPTADGLPTTINREIRRLLKSFDRSAYVGYTATPFANIYIGAYADHEEVGEDLFPRSFIESLKPPSNYFGPTRVFGLGGADDDEEVEPLPIHRSILDHGEWMPDRHKMDWLPSGIPPSLDEAISSFILVCAARAARGQGTEHNSMLVHVTRYVVVQNRVAEQVDDRVSYLRDRIRYGDGNSPERILETLQDLWENDFVPTTDAFDPEEARPVSWGELQAHLLPTIEKIEVRTINGSSKDALEYYEHRKTGLNVIAVGGAKLSRGLTLEGLSVSYYLRSSRMYDTLMQMGRWFGFRPGYEDLCRLYTTPELRSWYREITTASEELRAELEEMAAKGATPEDYGLRVRASSAGLTVTAPNKMRRAQRIRLSYSANLSETVLFDTRQSVLSSNRSALENLIRAIDSSSEPAAGSGNFIWERVSADPVLSFLAGYEIPRMARRVRPELISRYIQKCLDKGELIHWTVGLIGNQRPRATDTFSDRSVGLTFRNCLDPSALEAENRYSIRRVLSPADEILGLSPELLEVAFQRTEARYEGTEKKVTVASGTVIRDLRPPTQGLLLLYPLDPADYSDRVPEPMVGWAISFPRSEASVETEYLVNEIWNQLAFDEMEDDDE